MDVLHDWKLEHTQVIWYLLSTGMKSLVDIFNYAKQIKST